MVEKAAKLHARLQWETACERLAFVLQPPDGTPQHDAAAIGVALELAQAALDALQKAYCSDDVKGAGDAAS